MKTREYINGRWVVVDEPFRRYDTSAESSLDYISLLARNKRYQPVLAAPDLGTAIEAMGKSGYATDPQYAAKLRAMVPKTPGQQQFYAARADLLTAQQLGHPYAAAELGALLG